MAGYDFTLRYLMDQHPEHLAAWLVDQPLDAWEGLPQSVPALAREADHVVRVTVGGDTFIQHTEFQTRYDPDMIWRVLEYHVRLVLHHQQPVRSTVIWLTSEDYPDTAQRQLEMLVLGQSRLTFVFDEICLWQEDPWAHLEHIQESSLWSLLPLLPLMGQEPQPDIVETSVQLAVQVPDSIQRADISAGLAILGSLRYTEDWLYTLIKESLMEESPVVLDFIARGTRKAKQDDIVELLIIRFRSLADETEQAVRAITAIPDLEVLFREAARCDSLDAFHQSLVTITSP